MNTNLPAASLRWLAPWVLAAAGGLAWTTAAGAAAPEFVGILALAVEEPVAKQLEMTADQRTKLSALIDARETEAVELALQLKDLPAAERDAKLMPFRRESEAKGLALLTSAQRAKLERIQTEREAAAKPQGPEALQPGVAAEAAPAALPAPAAPTRPEAAPDAPAAEKPAAANKPAAEKHEAPDESPDDLDAMPEEHPKKPEKLQFNFRYAPWKEVLDWFARQADLSFVTENYPPGTFNYSDDREYTPAQAIDILNSVLLTKGYTLVRRERALMLINLEDGIPPNLIDAIEPEQLEGKGEYEMASVLFRLDKMTPEEAEIEIKRLLGPQGQIVSLPKSRQIQVTETAGRLRRIYSVIQRVEDPAGMTGAQLKGLDLKHIAPNDAMAVLRQLMDIPEGQFGSMDGAVRIALDPLHKRLLVSGRVEKLNRIEEILKFVDVPKPGDTPLGGIDDTPQLEVYAITTADSNSVLAVLQTLMAGMPDVRLALDGKTGNLIALARPSQHLTIKATLDQLQREARQVEVFQLRAVDPQLAVLTINKLFGGGGDPTKGPVNPTAPQVDADPTSRQLLVRGSASQIEQIRTLLEKLGETGAADASVAEAANNAKVRTIPLRGRTAQSAIEAIQDIWPTLRSNRIRVVTPAATIPSVRPSAAGDEHDLRTPPAPAKEPADAPAGKPATKAGGAVTPLPADPQYDKSPAEKTTQFEPRWSEVPVVFVADGLPVVPPPLVPKTTKAIEVEPAADGAATAPAAAPAVPVPTPPVAAPAAPTVSPAPPSQVPPIPAPVPRPAPGPAATPRKLADGKELPPIMVAPGPGGVVIACDDVEALNEFEELLNTLASGATSNVPEMTIFYLKHAKAASVAETLEQVLSGGTSGESSGGGGGGNLLTDIAGAAIGDRGGILGTLLGMGESGTIKPTGQLKITPDTRLNALVVQANAADTEMIEQLLKILDQKESPEDVLIVPKSKMIALKNTQAQEIAEIVRQVYQDRVVAGGAGGQQRPPSPQEFIQMLRGGRRGGGGGGRDRGGSADEPQKMSLSIDARTNSVILLAPEPLFSEVQQLIEQLDRAAVDSSQTMRVVTLQKASPDTVQQALMAIVGDGIQLGPGAQAAMRGSSRRSAMAQMQRMPGMQGGYTGQRTGGFQPGGMQPGGFQPGGFQPGGMQPGGFQQPFGGRSFGGQNFGGGQPGGFAPMNTGTRSFNTGNRGLTTGRGLSPGRSNTGRSNAGRGGRGG